MYNATSFTQHQPLAQPRYGDAYGHVLVRALRLRSAVVPRDYAWGMGDVPWGLGCFFSHDLWMICGSVGLWIS